MFVTVTWRSVPVHVVGLLSTPDRLLYCSFFHMCILLQVESIWIKTLHLVKCLFTLYKGEKIRIRLEFHTFDANTLFIEASEPFQKLLFCQNNSCLHKHCFWNHLIQQVNAILVWNHSYEHTSQLSSDDFSWFSV